MQKIGKKNSDDVHDPLCRNIDGIKCCRGLMRDQDYAKTKKGVAIDCRPASDIPNYHRLRERQNQKNEQERERRRQQREEDDETSNGRSSGSAGDGGPSSQSRHGTKRLGRIEKKTRVMPEKRKGGELHYDPSVAPVSPFGNIMQGVRERMGV